LQPIHVLLAELPQLLHDIVASALRQSPDIVLLDDKSDASSGSPEIDVLVIGVEPGDATARCSQILASHPHATVVAIEVDGRRVFLGELRPTVFELGEMDPQTLLDVARGRRLDRSI
jgi:hypothetical protein